MTPANRAQRVAQAPPRLVQWVRDARQRTDVPPERTVLAGFSQGASLAVVLAMSWPGWATPAAYTQRGGPGGRPMRLVHTLDQQPSHTQAAGVWGGEQVLQIAGELDARGAAAIQVMREAQQAAIALGRVKKALPGCLGNCRRQRCGAFHCVKGVVAIPQRLPGGEIGCWMGRIETGFCMLSPRRLPPPPPAVSRPWPPGSLCRWPRQTGRTR